MQNWNDGKAQEFKDRRLYEIEKSALNPNDRVGRIVPENPASEVAAPEMIVAPVAGNGMRTMLFTTKTCPNCKMARQILDTGNVVYDLIDAEEHAALCREYNVSRAPTLVVVEEDRVSTLSNIAGIKQFVKG